MQLLVRPESFVDEALESYFLRLASANYIESYQLFSGAIREWLWINDSDAAGAFPLELSKVNIYHAKQSSSLRVRSLKLVEALTDQTKLPLLNQAIFNSSNVFLNSFSAVTRDGVYIPRCFLRKSSIPVCSLCLQDAAYIRQQWHYSTYTACTEHQCELIDTCPKCASNINYLETELLERCSCGFEFKNAEVEKASDSHIKLSNVVAGNDSLIVSVPNTEASISICNSALLWYYLKGGSKLKADHTVEFSGFNGVIEYFSNWPINFDKELELMAEKAEQRLIKEFNKTAFSHVFGEILSVAIFPTVDASTPNFMFERVLEFLTQLVDENPSSKTANVADLLLTVGDVATILSTSHEQIYRLYQEGYLTLQYRPKLHTKLNSQMAAFNLRQVLEFRESVKQSNQGNQRTYLPGW
jgi:hypothetical protein